MLFSKNTLSKTVHGKKIQAVVLILLTTLIVIPFVSVQASVELLSFDAIAGSDFINLEWVTASESDNLGFNLFRGLTDDFNAALKLNITLIPGNPGSVTGASYEWLDSDVQVGVQYTYWLQDIGLDGSVTTHDPETASPTGGGSIPTVPAPSTSTATPTPSRTPTRTPTATTQSGSSVTQTPTNTPTASTNPTATTEAEVQATAVSNNASPASTSIPQSNDTGNGATVEPTKEDPTVEPTQDIAQLTNPTDEPVRTEVEEAPDLIAQSSTGANDSPPQSIGSDSDTQEASAGNSANGEASDRPTVVLMALIGSIVLLLIGGGGVAVLLLNRSKQMRT